MVFKYSAENGSEAVTGKSISRFPNLHESTLREFHKKCPRNLWFALKDDVMLEKKLGRDHGRGRAQPLGPVTDESLSQL